jgi:hypothetical protein
MDHLELVEQVQLEQVKQVQSEQVESTKGLGFTGRTGTPGPGAGPVGLGMTWMTIPGFPSGGILLQIILEVVSGSRRVVVKFDADLVVVQ